MTSGGNRYPEKADLGAGRTGGCRRDLIARVSLMPTPAANATVPRAGLPARAESEVPTGDRSRGPAGAPCRRQAAVRVPLPRDPTSESPQGPTGAQAEDP